MRVRVQSQLRIDLFQNAVDIGRGQIDLVDDGDDLQVVLHREVQIGQRLGLNALGRVDQQQDAFAGGQRPGYFVGKIDMPRGVDQVQNIRLAVTGAVGQGDGIAFDGDAALALDVHVVEKLILKISLVADAGVLDQPVGQRGLAVVDMGDNAEISDIFHTGLKKALQSFWGAFYPKIFPDAIIRVSSSGLRKLPSRRRGHPPR